MSSFTSTSPRVTVLGAGVIGAGMARSLHRDGLDVRVWNRSSDKLDRLSEEGVPVERELGAALDGADVVVTALFDLDATVAVVRAALPRLGKDVVVVQSGTIGRPGAQDIAALLSGEGIASLDAPVLGTKKPANDGALTVLVAGPAEVVDRIALVLDSIGARTVRVGETHGEASALKLACNSWVASVTVATAQAIALAQDGGVDPALFLEAIQGSAVDTPYAHVKGRAMMSASYDPSFALDGVIKDVDLMRAQATSTDSQVLDAMRAVFASASDQGHGADDMAAVFEGIRRG